MFSKFRFARSNSMNDRMINSKPVRNSDDQQVYERIERGHSLEEAEEAARRVWRK